MEKLDRQGHRTAPRRRADRRPLGAARLRGLRGPPVSPGDPLVLPARAPLGRRTGAARSAPPRPRLAMLRRIAPALLLASLAGRARPFCPPSTSAGTRSSTPTSTSRSSRPSISTSTTTTASGSPRSTRPAWPSGRYARLSKVLNHEFRERKPIILYASHSDFQQTNATEVGGEGTGGVTDFARNRAVMPFTGAYADFEHVLHARDGAPVPVRHLVPRPGRRGPQHADRHRAAALVRGRHGRVPLARADQRRDRDVAARRVARGQAADHRADDGRSRTSTSRTASVTRSGPTSASGGATRRSARSSRRRSSGGIEPAFRRTIGLTLEQLSDQWRDAVQKRYLPEIGARAKARAVADELLTEERSEGTLHLAPALSPDGSQVAYFSEKDFYFVDLYLADGVNRPGQAADPQVRHQQQLRDLPLHQLAGQLVAGRQVPRVRGQARTARRHRHRGRRPGTSRSAASSSS